MRRIAKNTVFLAGSELFAMVLQFLFVIVLTRHFGNTGFGQISFAISFAMIASIFGDIGLNTLVIRKIAQNEEDAENIISNALVVKILMSFILIVLTILFLWLSKVDHEKFFLVGIITLAFIVGTIAQLFRNVFQAFERMEYEAVVKIIYTVLYISLGLLVIILDYNIIFIGLSYFFGSLVNLIISARICFNKFSKFSMKFDGREILDLPRDAYPFAVSAVIASIFFNIDILMLEYFKGDDAAGWYSLAFRIMVVANIFPQFFVQAIFPKLCKLSSTAKESLYFALEKGIKYMVLIGLPMALIVTFSAETLILTVFGADFLNSVLAIQILIWCAAIIYFSMVVAATVNAMNKQKQNMYIFLFNVILNVILNILLIPKYSLYGAAAATIITQGVGVVLTCTLIPNFFDHFKKIKIEKTIISGFFMALVLALFHNHQIMGPIVSLFVFAIATYLLKNIERKEIDLLKEVLVKSSSNN